MYSSSVYTIDQPGIMRCRGHAHKRYSSMNRVPEHHFLTFFIRSFFSSVEHEKSRTIVLWETIQYINNVCAHNHETA